MTGSVAVGSLGIAALALPGQAGATVQRATTTGTYTCTGSALGQSFTYTGTVAISGTFPASVKPSTAFTMTGFQTKVTIPAATVNQILAYTSTISGRVSTFDIKASSGTTTVNAAGKGISIPTTTLHSNTPLTLTLPKAPVTVTGFKSGPSAGTITFSTGKIGITISVLGISVSVSCTPKPVATLGHTTVT